MSCWPTTAGIKQFSNSAVLYEQNYTTTCKERTGDDRSKGKENKKYLLPQEILNAGNALWLAM